MELSPHLSPGYLLPEWPAPANVHALTTLRKGGYSTGPYTSFNLALHSDDDPIAVQKNRELLRSYFELPAEPIWLQQVHSNQLIEAVSTVVDTQADGCWSRTPGYVCAVMTADCLPVLICDRSGTKVAAAHAGWRGLYAGVITNAVNILRSDPAELVVWLGPAIGPLAFEVGLEVMQSFTTRDQANTLAFRQVDDSHWLCDIYQLAKIELAALGVTAVYGGDECSYADEQRFYSYRRDGITGRMASVIWLE
ncbi:MAG: peptidoglycan editing factor PgeF [Gammaproteobacteria bacterium]|nr:peptidoglycan editing factor PgeF [Gammaproteobacteria bacterium]NNJ97497.1 peptidoglycan editing factor PgeF [Gammaproteobacteria bacterium]